MMQLEKNKVFIQIGTNDGNDEFNGIARKYKPSLLILVEPNKELNNKIIYHYAGVSNAYIENVAIMERKKKSVDLVHPKNIYNKKGERISDWNYVDVHFSILPMDDWGDNFDKFSSPVMTFDQLCEKYKIKDIEYLQIDTEGYDAEIIKSIDFTKYNIKVLKYEDWSFPEKAFTRYGKKASLYGVNGMRFVANILLTLGYTLKRESSDILAVKNYQLI